MNELTVVLRARDLATRTIARVGRTLRTLGRGGAASLRRLASAATSAQAAIAAIAAGGLIGSFAGFDEGVRATGTLINSTTEDIARFRTELQGISRDTGQPLDALSKSLFDAVSGGVDAGEAVKFLGDSSRLAVAGVTSVDAATEGLVRVMVAYNREAKDAGDISDAFFAAQQQGITTIAELGPQIGKVASQAQAAGLSIEQLFAVTASLTKALPTEVAITTVQSFLNALSKPPKELEPLIRQLEALGFSLNLESLRSDPVKFFRDLATVTGGSSEAFRRLFADANAANAAIILSANNSNVLETSLRALENRAGATAKGFAIIEDGLKNRLARAFRSVQGGAFDVIAKIAPALGDGADAVRKFGEALTNNSDEIGAWARLAVDLVGEAFRFIGGRIERYADDSNKVWSDAGAVIGAFARAAVNVISSAFRLAGIAAFATFDAIRDGAQSVFQGFDASALTRFEDPFKRSRQSVNFIKSIDQGLAEAGKRSEELARQLAAVDRSSDGAANTIAYLGTQISFTRGQIEQLQKRRENAVNLLGFDPVTIESFSQRLSGTLDKFGAESVAEMRALGATLGQEFRSTLGEIGADATVEGIDQALARFRSKLDEARGDSGQGAAATPEQLITGDPNFVQKAVRFGGAIVQAMRAAIGKELATNNPLAAGQALLQLDPAATAEIEQQIRNLQASTGLLQIADPIAREVAAARAEYDKDVENYRKALDAKKISQEQFDTFVQARAANLTALIGEINSTQLSIGFDAGGFSEFESRLGGIRDTIAILESDRGFERRLVEIQRAYARELDGFRRLQEQKLITLEEFHRAEAAIMKAQALEAREAQNAITGFLSESEFNEQVSGTLNDRATDLFVNLTNFADKARASFKDLVNSALADLSRLFLSRAFQLLLRGPGGDGGLLGAFGINLVQSANGNVLQGGFQAFANGSPRVTSPTLGLVGEGRYNEAVVPLPDGRRIPVELTGGGGGGTTLNLTFNVASLDPRSAAQVIGEQAPTIKAIYRQAIAQDPGFRAVAAGRRQENR